MTSANLFQFVGWVCLGKTTLARKVYHQGQVRSPLDGFAWAYISQQCQPKDVLQGILIYLTSATSSEKIEISHTREEELVKKLYQIQQEKKCLVILHDIWTTQARDNLRPAFPFGQAASKILLTTRNKDVAMHADPQGFLHEPWYLTEEQSWQLLQRKAMPSRRDPTGNFCYFNAIDIKNNFPYKKPFNSNDSLSEFT